MTVHAKRKLPKSLSLLLAAILVFGMVLIPANKAKADETVVVENINASSYDLTAVETGGDHEYPFVMPQNGTLEVTYVYAYHPNAINICNSAGTILSPNSSCSTKVNGLTGKQLFYAGLNKGQTYTLKLTVDYPVLFKLRYASESVDVNSGKTVYASSRPGKVSYFQVKMPKNGYFNVEFGNACSQTNPYYYVQLLNAKKKPISHGFEKISMTNGSTNYGVKKGVYYLGVKTASNSPIYSIKITKKAVATKAGAKASKAVVLKRGKAKSGVINTANKKVAATHWYKIKLTRQKKVTIYIQNLSSLGGLRVSIIPPKGYLNKLTKVYPNNQTKGTLVLSKTTSISSKSQPLDPGTYYICVSGNKYGSGYYALKWK